MQEKDHQSHYAMIEKKILTLDFSAASIQSSVCAAKSGEKVDMEVECRGIKIKCERLMHTAVRYGKKNAKTAITSTFNISAIVICS